MKRRLRDAKRLAGPLGWALDGITGGGHLRLRHEGGGVYYASATPGDWRAQRRMLADLKRMAPKA